MVSYASQKKQGVVGIYGAYTLLKGSSGGVKQLGSLHPKGFPTIFPMSVLILCSWRSIACGFCMFFLCFFGPLKCYPRKIFTSSNLHQKTPEKMAHHVGHTRKKVSLANLRGKTSRKTKIAMEISGQTITTTRPHPKRWLRKGNPVISRKSRLVKYFNLARKFQLFDDVVSFQKIVIFQFARHVRFQSLEGSPLCPQIYLPFGLIPETPKFCEDLSLQCEPTVLFFLSSTYPLGSIPQIPPNEKRLCLHFKNAKNWKVWSLKKRCWLQFMTTNKGFW